MSEFGMIGYAIVAMLYLALSILLVTSWRGRNPGGYFIAACVMSSIWAITLAMQSSGWSIPDFAIFSVEIVRGGAWLTFVVMLVAPVGVSPYVRYCAQTIWIGVFVAGFVAWLIGEYSEPVIDIGSVMNTGGLLVALVGLVLIEQLYRNSQPESRWGAKALALGLGGLFAYDLFLYSQGVLFSVLDNSAWIARGAVNILFVPMIAVAARRSPDWELNIFVSRQVVFYTTSLIAIGLYLLVMGLGGYALSIFGGIWGDLARIIFLAGAGLVLIVLLFSDVIRARLRVFLSKHFFRNKYDYRDEWLRLVSTLSGFEDSSTREIVIKALAQIVQSSAGLLWVLNEKEDAYQVVAAYRAEENSPDISVDDPMVRFINRTGWLIDLEEFVENKKLYADIELPNWLTGNPEAWLIVPLITRQKLLGLAQLNKAPVLPKLNYEDRDLLKTVGNHIAVHLAQDKSDDLLTESRQFEAYNRLTAFLMHDLNNLIAQQSLIVKNAEKHKRNPEFVDDAMQTIANSVVRMKRVMDQLRRGEADKRVRTTELNAIALAAVDRCSGAEPVPSLQINDCNATVEVDAEQFTMVLTHLVQNAQDSTANGGDVSVVCTQNDGNATIIVSDTGSGMSPAFVRDRLFRPFDSTKGSQGMGIGAYQAREFARKLGGDLKVQSEVSKGTAVTMYLPLAQPDNQLTNA